MPALFLTLRLGIRIMQINRDKPSRTGDGGIHLTVRLVFLYVSYTDSEGSFRGKVLTAFSVITANLEEVSHILQNHFKKQHEWTDSNL